MDEFSFLFSFYGLILGLAVAELLAGFAGFVRSRPLRSIEAQTALLALLTFICICATWMDAWSTLRSMSRGFASLWAPVGIATSYYLAASVLFPRDPADYDDLAGYFARRKRFVIWMLLAGEVLVTVTFWPVFAEALRSRPDAFWFYHVPYNVLIKGSWIALLIVRGRPANLALMAFLILLFLIPYWSAGWINRLFG